MEQETITLTLHYSRSDVRMIQTHYGVELAIKEGTISSNPGEPGFPIHKVEVAIPKGMEASRVTARVIQTTPLTSSPTFVTPVRQEFIPYRDPNEPNRSEFRWVDPDPASYEDAVKNMRRHNAWLLGSRIVGNIYVATIAIRPIRYDEFACLELISEIELKISLKPIKTKPLRIQRGEEMLSSTAGSLNMLERRVINPDLIRKIHSSIEKKLLFNHDLAEDIVKKIDKNHKLNHDYYKQEFLTPIDVPVIVDYLIITDDHTWDAKKIMPLKHIGDLPGAFEELAQLRESHGLITHIASISNIVKGRYGNFRRNARDLQEIIRNFLKHFVKTHHTKYLLIGGTDRVVPSRKTCACVLTECVSPEKKDYFNYGHIEWKGTYGGMVLTTHGDGVPIYGKLEDILTIEKTGEIIPYSKNGLKSDVYPCWYHTTDDKFDTFSETVTRYVRVDAPKDVVNGIFCWYGHDNLIPTDLYYASLFNEEYYNIRGKHDWDYLGNGLYGQWSNEKNLDKIDYLPDIHYGRVPVKTVDEVRTYIRKIKAYESSIDRPEESARFDKILLVAEKYERKNNIDREYVDHLRDLGANKYSPLKNENRTLIRLSQIPEDSSVLLCYNNGIGYHQIFDHNWDYVIGPDILIPSYSQLYFIDAKCKKPTIWIIVRSYDKKELEPSFYQMDPLSIDDAIKAQEEIRDLIDRNHGVMDIHRLYDYEKSFWEKEALSSATLRHLNKDNLINELSTDKEYSIAPHIVSLSGHGSPSGSCHYGQSVLREINNQDQTFIVLADGCNTSMFDDDYDDYISRHSVLKEDGGAIAYLGFSRMSFCGHGTMFTKRFFDLLTTGFRRPLLGELFSTSGVLSPSHYQEGKKKIYWEDWTYRWMALAYQLIGDPGLPIFMDKNDMESVYVANKKTKELHKRDCEWVKEMADWNVIYLKEKEWALAHGYDGCYYCLREHHTH